MSFDEVEFVCTGVVTSIYGSPDAFMATPTAAAVEYVEPPVEPSVEPSVEPDAYYGVAIDTTGDGVADAVGYDTTGDGEIDLVGAQLERGETEIETESGYAYTEGEAGAEAVQYDDGMVAGLEDYAQAEEDPGAGGEVYVDVAVEAPGPLSPVSLCQWHDLCTVPTLVRPLVLYHTLVKKLPTLVKFQFSLYNCTVHWEIKRNSASPIALIHAWSLPHTSTNVGIL